jgi:hypothetical protein
MRWWARGWMPVVVVLAQHEARAQPTPPEAADLLVLDWTAPADECPTGEDVVRDVTRLVGPIERPRKHEPLKAEARLSRSADGRWHVRIRTLGPTGGERTLEAASCQALAKAAALVLALRLNPKLLSSPPPPEPPPPPPPPPPAPTPPPAPPPPPPSPAEREQSPERSGPLGASVGVAWLQTVGELPSLEEGGELIVGYAPPSLRGRVRIEAYGESDILEQHGSAGADVGGGALRALAGGLRGCAGPGFGSFYLLGCGGAQVDYMRVEGVGAVSGQAQTNTSLRQAAAWATVDVGGQARWVFARRFAIRLDLMGLLPINPPRFVVQNTSGDVLGVVSHPSTLWANLGIGADVFFF